MAIYVLKHTILEHSIVKGYTYLPRGDIVIQEIDKTTPLLHINYAGKYDNKVKIKNELIIDDLLQKNIITKEILTDLFVKNYLFDANDNLSSNLKAILNTDNRVIKIYPYLVKEFMKYKNKNNIDITGTVLDNVMFKNVKYDYMQVLRYNNATVGKTGKQIRKTSEEKRFTSLLEDEFIDYDGIEKYLPTIFDVFKYTLLNQNYVRDGRISRTINYWSQRAKMVKFEITDADEIIYLDFTAEEYKKHNSY